MAMRNEIYEILKFGVFCLYKTENITSAKTLEFVKKAIRLGKYTISILNFLLHIKHLYVNIFVIDRKEFRKLKVGHGGTLDSYATGVLGKYNINYFDYTFPCFHNI